MPYSAQQKMMKATNHPEDQAIVAQIQEKSYQIEAAKRLRDLEGPNSILYKAISEDITALEEKKDYLSDNLRVVRKRLHDEATQTMRAEPIERQTS